MNILYIVCHDLGRHLGCYERPVRTPHLDQFARSAMRFDRMFCNTAVCSPSRGACMTGMYAHNNGMMGLAHFGWRIFPGVRTVVDYFNEAGFETVHCGLSHEGEEAHSRYQTDFEVSWDAQLAENAVDDAIAWLRARQRQGRTTPFYMNLGTREVHPCVWRVDEERPGIPSRFHRVYGGKLPEEEIHVPPPTPDIPLTRDDFGRFEPAIRFLDAQMGRLFAEIETLGLFEDTMVIFTTDHGMNDWHGKGHMYDRGTEIAFLLRAPDSINRPGAVFPELLQNMDVTPTLLEAAGAPVSPAIQGRSFWPLIIGDSCQPHEHIFLEWNFGGPQDDYSPVRAVRSHTHKLIRNLGPHHYGQHFLHELTPDFTAAQRDFCRFKTYGMSYTHPERWLPEWELYDLRSDPHELHNVADDPAHADEMRTLQAALDDWMRRTDDHVLRGEIPVVPAERDDYVRAATPGD